MPPRLSEPLENLETNSLDRFAVTVMGVGNPIMGDDGVGIELVERLRSLCTDPRVEFVDGGTGGLELLHVVQDAERLLLLDAVAGPTPGEIVELVGDQLPRLMSQKLSPHQVGLLDIFSAARMLDCEPDQIMVLGVVPENVESRVGLSPVVEQALPELTKRALAIIEQWLTDADHSWVQL